LDEGGPVEIAVEENFYPGCDVEKGQIAIGLG
jgi:hypothetical protein